MWYLDGTIKEHHLFSPDGNYRLSEFSADGSLRRVCVSGEVGQKILLFDSETGLDKLNDYGLDHEELSNLKSNK